MIFTPGKQRKIIHCNLMQAALGAVQNPRCAVVIHNVRSCSKVVWDAFRSLGEKCREITGNRKMDGFLFCTGLTDQDAVFGGNEKLRRCLEDICDEIHPEVILVVCGCVPGVIGDDTEALCQEVEAETGRPSFCCLGTALWCRVWWILLLPWRGCCLIHGLFRR